MTDITITDATILASLLTELRLPSIARNWKRITEAANREGWPAQKTLATLLEIEVAERASRRIQRHRDQSETPVGKTFASFDFTAAPELSKPHLLALGAGGDWIKNGDNLLLFGESGTGKSHALAAICHALIDAGKRVLFTQTIDMVQRLHLLGQRPREVRQIRPHRPRRHLVCSQGSSRDQRPVRTHRPSIRTTQHRYHRQPVVFGLERSGPRPERCRQQAQCSAIPVHVSRARA